MSSYTKKNKVKKNRLIIAVNNTGGDESEKRVLNIHQLKVLEKINQKKKQQNATSTINSAVKKPMTCDRVDVSKFSNPFSSTPVHNTRSSKLKNGGKKEGNKNCSQEKDCSVSHVSPAKVTEIKKKHSKSSPVSKKKKSHSTDCNALSGRSSNVNLKPIGQNAVSRTPFKSQSGGKSLTYEESLNDVEPRKCLKRRREASNLSSLNAPNKPVDCKSNTDKDSFFSPPRKQNKAERRLKKYRESLVLENKLINSDAGPSTKLVDTEEDMDTFYDANVNSKFNALEDSSENEEIMDWESVDFNEIKTFLSSENNDEDSLTPVDHKENIKIVVDTNILIHHLSLIMDVVESKNDKLQVVIPWVVLEELDNLKTRSHISSDARKAITFIHKSLMDKKICGQSSLLSKTHLFKCENADDEILNCCLQVTKDFKTIFITNDINLCNKALVNNIQVATYQQFMSNHWHQLRMNKTKSVVDNKKCGPLELNVYLKSYKKLEEYLIEGLSTVLKEEMIKKYDDLWPDIVLYKPPWSVKQLIKCFSKHWIAVFGDILNKEILKHMNTLLCLIEDDKVWNEEKILQIQDCCRNMFIYFRSTSYEAVTTPCLNYLDSLMHHKTSETDDIKKSDNTLKAVSSHQNVRTAMQYIFESLGKYCSNLADNLGIAHNLKIPVDQLLPLDSLLPQADAVGNQLQILISSLEKIVLMNQENVTSDSPSFVSKMESAFYVFVDTLKGVGRGDLSIGVIELIDAYRSDRGIFTKYIADLRLLNDLILECSDKFASMQK